MTSGNFSVVNIDDILIERETRQRKQLKGIEELADSIRRNGLINPIVITKDYKLIAGERRLTAHQLLGFDQIMVQFIEDMSYRDQRIIELEENVRRVDLDWKDQVEAAAEIHLLLTQEAEEQGERWSQEKTAEHLGTSQQNIDKYLKVKAAIDEGVEEVINADKLSVAHNFTMRRAERRAASAMRELRQQGQITSAELEDGQDNGSRGTGEEDNPSRYVEVLNQNFIQWSAQVQAEPYNLIHCDFPYGVNAGDTRGQSGAKTIGGYDDKPELYFELLETLCNNLDNFCGPSAHLVFWFSMDFYEETLRTLRAAGWTVSAFPLIWYKSDNTGILPDKNRGPRRIYETAFFGSRGDRKVVQAVGNAVASGVTKNYHMSEKPHAMLSHFFRMLVDDTTRLLDPTCGSGMALKVAEEHGAVWSTGLELNPDYVEAAKENLGI